MRVVLISCLSGLLLGLIWLGVNTPDTESVVADIHTPEKDKAFTLDVTDTDDLTKLLSADSQLFTEAQLNRCRALYREYEEQQLAWLDGRQIVWNDLLEQGYEREDVAGAIGFIHNQILATHWYLEHQRWPRLQSRLVEALGNEAELVLRSQVNFSPEIPHPLYEWLPDMDDAEFEALLEDQPPTVDELAYFLSMGNLPAPRLQAISEAVERIDDIVIYDELNTTSVLDYAIYYGYPNLVASLMERGLGPTEDRVLPNSLDWALSAYQLSDTDNDSRASEVLSLIYGRQQQASFRVTPGDDITSVTGGPGGYRFDGEARRRLEQLGVVLGDPVLFPSVFDMGSASPLRDWFADQKAEYMQTYFGMDNVQGLLDVCNDVVSAKLPAWKPAAIDDLKGELAALSEAELTAAAREIDPSLPRCLEAPLTLPVAPEWLRQTFYIRVYDNGMQEALSWLIRENGDNALNVRLFVDMISDFSQYLGDVVRAGIVPDTFDYRWLALFPDIPSGIQSLEALGYPTRERDESGRPLLFYAIQSGQVAIAEYLLAADYPVNADEGVEDPLDVLLSPYRRISQTNQIIPLLTQLMERGARVDAHHRQRLQVLKRTSTSLYDAMTMAYPELAVDDAQPLPRFICPRSQALLSTPSE